jgi:hypothetical protein
MKSFKSTGKILPKFSQNRIEEDEYCLEKRPVLIPSKSGNSFSCGQSNLADFLRKAKDKVKIEGGTQYV